MFLSKLRNLSAFTKLSLFSLLLLLFAVIASVSLSLSQQKLKSRASFATQSAAASCDLDGNAVIQVSFSNTVSDNSLVMNVTAKDVQTGISTDIGSVSAQQTGNASILTRKSQLDSSSVIFFLTWANDPTSTSQSGASYAAINCTPPTVFPTPTLIPPLPTDTPTPTPTPAPTLTPTPAPTSTPTPTAVPTPSNTPTPPPGTFFNFNIFLHGIGASGDSANPTSTGNKNPLHKSLAISIDLYNTQNQLILSKSGNVNYASTSGNFIGSIDMGNALADGAYTIKIKADKYLRTSIPGIVSVTAGKENTLKRVDLPTGDINNDNVMNILDYNLLMGCYSDLYPAKSCTNSAASDLTDDGFVNQFDYNLFLRELTTKGGE